VRREEGREGGGEDEDEDKDDGEREEGGCRRRECRESRAERPAHSPVRK